MKLPQQGQTWAKLHYMAQDFIFSCISYFCEKINWCVSTFHIIMKSITFFWLDWQLAYMPLNIFFYISGLERVCFSISYSYEILTIELIKPTKKMKWKSKPRKRSKCGWKCPFSSIPKSYFSEKSKFRLKFHFQIKFNVSL